MHNFKKMPPRECVEKVRADHLKAGDILLPIKGYDDYPYERYTHQVTSVSNQYGGVLVGLKSKNSQYLLPYELEVEIIKR